MGMGDPIPTFTEFATRVRDLYPDFAWLHAVEPRVNGFQPREVKPGESNDFLRRIWGSRPLIATGGFDREDAINTAEQRGGLIGFGRYFVANVRSPPFVTSQLCLESTR
jgi:NADPH2 dehydrogenase